MYSYILTNIYLVRFNNGYFTDYKLNLSSEGSSVDEGRESYLQYTYNIEDIFTDSDGNHIYILSAILIVRDVSITKKPKV